MISVEGDFVRTCCTGEGEFGIKRGNIGVLAGFVLFLAGICDFDNLVLKVLNFYRGTDGKLAKGQCYIVNSDLECVADKNPNRTRFSGVSHA